MDRMIRVYVAGALNDMAVNYIKNVSRMIRWDRELRSKGFAIFNPSLDMLVGIHHGSMEYEDYANPNMEWLRASHAVFVCPMWENSKGTKAEIKEAKRLNIPVFYNIDEIVYWKTYGRISMEDLGKAALLPIKCDDEMGRNLLDRLWKAYEHMIQEFSRLCTCDASSTTNDNDHMVKLRQDLFDYGVKGIAGFKYMEDK